METCRSTRSIGMGALTLAALAAGCAGDEASPSGPAQRPAGAILIAERFNTPDGRAAYMGAFPELPTGTIDVSRMVELGPEGDAFACGGNAFFYNPDAGSITKWIVGDDLRLARGPSIDVRFAGIVGWTGAHVCASATQAFILNESGGRVVEWNPETMVILGAFDVPRPDVPAGLSVQFFEPKIAGNLAYFGVTAIDWDTLAVAPRAILAVLDVASKTLSFDYDDRCQGSLGGFVDGAGNYYQLPEDGGFFETYSPSAPLPPDCVLRVNAGEKAFDDGWVLQLEEGQSLRSMWPVDDGHVLATIIPIAAAPAPENLWDWYSLPVAPTLVDLDDGSQAPYPSLPDVQPMNSRKLVLDGKSYYQVYTFDGEGRVSRIQLVELTPGGALPAFTLEGGDLLTLERLW